MLFLIKNVTASTVENFQIVKEAGELFCKYVQPISNKAVYINICPVPIGFKVTLDKESNWLCDKLQFMARNYVPLNSCEKTQHITLAVQVYNEYTVISIADKTFHFYSEKNNDR